MWIQIYKYWCSSHVAELCYTYMQRSGKGTVFKSLFSIFLEIWVFVHISCIFPLLWLWTTWLPYHTNFRLKLQAGMNYLKNVFPHKMITLPATSSLAEFGESATPKFSFLTLEDYTFATIYWNWLNKMYHSQRKISANFCEDTETLVLPCSIDVVASFSSDEIPLTKSFFILSSWWP